MAVSLSEVSSKWASFVDSLHGFGSTGNLDAFLRSACVPVAVRGTVVILEFEYEFHKGKCESGKHKQIIEEKLSQALGTALQIECHLRGEGVLRGDEVRVLVSRITDGAVVTHTNTGQYAAVWHHDAKGWSLDLYSPDGEEIPSQVLGQMSWGLIQRIVRRSEK